MHWKCPSRSTSEQPPVTVRYRGTMRSFMRTWRLLHGVTAELSTASTVEAVDNSEMDAKSGHRRRAAGRISALVHRCTRHRIELSAHLALGLTLRAGRWADRERVISGPQAR